MSLHSLYAAHLAKLHDVEVWAYDLSREHVDAINKNGLRLTGLSDFTAEVKARSDPGEIPECELGIIATFARYKTVSAVKTSWPNMCRA